MISFRLKRLFRIKVANDPYCLECFDLVGGVIGDREHLFCSCILVKDLRVEKRKILADLVSPSVSMISNLDLITLNFPKNDSDDSCILHGLDLEKHSSTRLTS